MSWKNVKEHYRIGHIVRVREGKICIGSPYVSNLIMVSFEGEVSWGSLGPAQNDDLARYHAEMTADIGKLRELIAAPDTFDRSLQVFTYEGGDILEKQCEALGWPNVTHDGCLQYENTFSADRDEVVGWAKRNAECGIKMFTERIKELEQDVIERRELLAKEKAVLEKLERKNPDSAEDAA